MGPVIAQSMHQEAVAHARIAEKAAGLAWTHLQAEYTQDIDQVLATLATDAPLTWTLPEIVGDDGSTVYYAGTTFDEIRERYRAMRHFVEIHGWEALVEIRQGWYTLTQGVVTLKMVETGEFTRGETVTMFPIGDDGILGEVQIGAIFALPPLDPSGPTARDGAPLPQRRLEALAFHRRYVDALRTADVDAIAAANRVDGAAAIRNYLTDHSTVLTANGSAALGKYFAELFERYQVRDVQMVNRVVESWYVFAELHWIVEERAGARRTLEFCTAETSSLDADGRYWARTGAGTDPVEV